MRAFLVPVSVVGFVAALGCGGLVPELSDLESEAPPSADWVGTWSWSDGDRTATLDIAPDGAIAWDSQSANSTSQMAGPASGWDEGTIECCLGLKSFDIDAPPTQAEDGTWTLQLDGRTNVGTSGKLEPADEEVEALLEDDAAP